jgi:flavin-dependent dehydrogenase
MDDKKIYDLAITGGGLAGLALAIQAARAGWQVVLFEKEQYPFHKVCGEYISLESWNFLEELGVPLSQMDLPIIRKLLVTSPSGKSLRQELPLGGFGISRYKLDETLANIATRSGVTMMTNTRVNDIHFKDEIFETQVSGDMVKSKLAAGCFGKRSNLDVKWKRKFVLQKQNKLNNYVGIKYHIRKEWPQDLIALHNFEDGYAGISRIENGLCCFCYLTTAKNLALSGNSIEVMEKNILQKNTFLRDILQSAEKLPGFPVTISQISFDRKNLVEDHVILLGDAAGMISPLCGNGMSMALHGSKIAFEKMKLFMEKGIPRWEMEEQYRKAWKENFSSRLRTGRTIQRFFGRPILSNLLVSTFRRLPFLAKKLVSATHGQPF